MTPSQDDIGGLQRALDEARQRCLELQRQIDRANAQFEEFVSRAAHNLREPLRDVASYAQLLSETYAGRLDSNADMFLDRIREGAARMHSLLADVVDYWSAGACDSGLSRIDMEAVLCQTLLSMDAQIAERRAVVTHDPMPVVMGDFEILARILRHLIRNALEFCEEPCPSVHISSRREECEWVVSVKDRGPGIDLAFLGRIFKPFKPLHGNEHPGNGLGLSFCKKAIEARGGRMWIESAPGAGSTFYFTAAPAD